MKRDPDPDVALYYAMARERLAMARHAFASALAETNREWRATTLEFACEFLLSAHVDRELARDLRRKRHTSTSTPSASRSRGQ